MMFIVDLFVSVLTTNQGNYENTTRTDSVNLLHTRNKCDP